MQNIIRNINSTQFGLSVQDAILNGYLVTKSFGKPSVGYMAVMSKDEKAQLTQVGGLGDGIHTIQKIDYQLNLDLRDTNPLHFALKLQQAILGGYRIKPDLRFGKFGVVWYASLEIGKGQLEELLKKQNDVKVVIKHQDEEHVLEGYKDDQIDEVVTITKQPAKKRTTKQTVSKEQ